MAARLRFAPSPTGKLHLGGMRTALFNYLWAKKLNGSLILRIEDTDQTRFVPGAQEEIIEHLDWAGIKFDEGPHVGGKYGPYVQSHRMAIYQQHASLLEKSEAVYKCFCTSERLENVRQQMQKKGTNSNYDRKCMHLHHDQIHENLEKKLPYTLRLKVPEGATIFEDSVYGKIEVQNNQIDDQILLKSDGLPTYHLANVVDDHLMQVSHVMRGEEWLSSTPKHKILYEYFGWKAPEFAHLPLLLNEDRSKLSKRHGNVDVGSYRQAGYEPQALLNFVAFLGWNPKSHKEIFTLEELVQEFGVTGINRAGSVVVKQKLNWFNKEHLLLSSSDPHQLSLIVDSLACLLSLSLSPEQLFSPDVMERSYIQKVFLATKERIHILKEVAESFSFFFANISFNSPSYQAFLTKFEPKVLDEVAGFFYEGLKEIPRESFTEDKISALLKEAGKLPIAPGGKQLSFKQAMLSARLLVTGTEVGPGVAAILALIGRDEVLKRIAMYRTERGL